MDFFASDNFYIEINMLYTDLSSNIASLKKTSSQSKTISNGEVRLYQIFYDILLQYFFRLQIGVCIS